MSHKASHWLAEIPASLINASAFRVLFHLCDAHNSKRPPLEACFPQHKLLLEATGLSNGGLNNALNALEAVGLMRRVRTCDETGKRRNYYILGCDFDLLKEQSPNYGDTGNSNLEGDQTPFCEGPNSSSVEFHIEAEPVKEPVKEPVTREDALPLFSETQNLPAIIPPKVPDLFAEFWDAYPKCPRKTDKPKAKALFDRIIAGKHHGIGKTSAQTIIDGLRRYARTSPDPQYVPLPTTWLNGERWTQFAPDSEQLDPERARLRAITANALAAMRPAIGRPS